MYQDTEVFNIDKPGLVSETFPEFCQMTLANILSRLQDLRSLEAVNLAHLTASGQRLE